MNVIAYFAMVKKSKQRPKRSTQMIKICRDPKMHEKKQLARIEARKKDNRSKIINLKYNVEITTFVHINNTISGARYIKIFDYNKVLKKDSH